MGQSDWTRNKVQADKVLYQYDHISDNSDLDKFSEKNKRFKYSAKRELLRLNIGEISQLLEKKSQD